jgi:predicted phosphodiesterase
VQETFHTLADKEVALRRLLGGETYAQVEAATGISASTLQRFKRKRAANVQTQAPAVNHAEPTLPRPAPEAGGPGLPTSIAKPLTAFDATLPGWWLVLNDTHIPMHDVGTIEAAVAEAKEKNVAGILLNGDMMDCFSLSPFFRIPSKDTFKDELDCAKQFLQWLRHKFPKARIVFREGNHEFRFIRYLVDRAAALYELESNRLPALLDLPKLGIEWVDEKRKVMLGKLITLHGHELRKGDGVNPARFAFLRTSDTVLVGHWHRTSEHHQRALSDRHFACWSVGCACYMSPHYDPYNQWNHGFAMVEISQDGLFSVHNRRVMHGRTV